ncbi:hypothetical protein SCOCK_330015 [Actinacidiphila cocklensis]|uniref:Uncharacterized protein n=1 Tax=Actinacidiphila cocklensis TaxID=887465 RepID=A0A9W4E8H0_9ACTN|nr:hypothetical protein SCOCK_330015 [Actinacidiphila cocklensis]
MDQAGHRDPDDAGADRPPVLPARPAAAAARRRHGRHRGGLRPGRLRQTGQRLDGQPVRGDAVAARRLGAGHRSRPDRRVPLALAVAVAAAPAGDHARGGRHRQPLLAGLPRGLRPAGRGARGHPRPGHRPPDPTPGPRPLGLADPPSAGADPTARPGRPRTFPPHGLAARFPAPLTSRGRI